MTKRNRHIRRGLMITLALVLACATALASLSYPFTSVTTEKVRLRRNPSSRATVLENVNKGATVEVLGAIGNYFKVKHGKYTGYILKEYINQDESIIITPAPEQEETVSGYPYVTVAKESVNLRGAKSTRAKLLKKIPRGASVTVNAVNGTWADVTYNSISGYCVAEYLVLKTVVKTSAPTATPTPAPTLTAEEDAGGYTVLQEGDSGKAVKALQRAMIELGFMNSGADGNFGSATKYGVVQFQTKNEYPATGIVDANLQAFLYSGTPLNARGEAVKIKTLSPAAGVSIRPGNVGDEVGELQERLKELKYYNGPINFTYDDDTVKAVRAFQKKNGLKADGIAGAETRKAIASANAVAADTTATPEPTAAPTPEPTFDIPDEAVKLNSRGAAARKVQKRLKDLGYYRGLVDGIFGKASVTALKKFQTAHGMESDGTAGPATYAVMFSNAALPYGATPTPAPTETPTPVPETPVVPYVPETPTPVAYRTLRKGDRGEEVALMQERLIVLYYLEGPADGNYGNGTAKAVRAFQKQNGLKQDGVAGQETLALLYSESAAPAPTAGPATPTPTPTPKPSATPTKTPGATAGPTPTATVGVLRKGDKGPQVKSLQTRLKELGYLAGKADGIYGAGTFLAVLNFQKMNRLKADGIAGVKTQTKLNSSSAIAASGGTQATPTPTPVPTAAPPTNVTLSADKVIYANWYTTVKAICRKFPYATVYDFSSGISWQIHMFSLGAHADYEPLTANDTARMVRAFNGNTWNPKAVWVLFADGSVYMASTHSMPHEVQHITDNNFPGHSCLHFPRTQAQVEAIGRYATSHQTTIDAGWAKTQLLAGK